MSPAVKASDRKQGIKGRRPLTRVFCLTIDGNHAFSVWEKVSPSEKSFGRKLRKSGAIEHRAEG